MCPMKSNAIHSFESITVCACVQWFPPPIWLRPHWGIFYLLSHPPPYCNHHTIAHFHTHCSQCKFKNHIVASKSTIPTPTAFLVKTTMLTYLLNAVHCYAVIFSNICFECILSLLQCSLALYQRTSVPVYQCTWYSAVQSLAPLAPNWGKIISDRGGDNKLSGDKELNCQ